MTPREPDSVAIGHLQSILAKDSIPLVVTQVLNSSLPPTTPSYPRTGQPCPSPGSPNLHNTATTSHDRTADLHLTYPPLLSDSQIDVGETQIVESFQHGGVEVAASQHYDLPLERKDGVNNEQEVVVLATSSAEFQAAAQSSPVMPGEEALPLDNYNEDELRPAYFPEANRFDNPRHTCSSPTKSTGHNPLEQFNLGGTSVPMSLTQIFNAPSSPVRPRSASSVAPTPSTHAAKMMAGSLSRTLVDLPLTKDPESAKDRPPFIRGKTEPVYISMQESQEARDRIAKRRGIGQSGSGSISPDDSDSDDGMSSRSEKMRKKADAARKKGDAEVRQLFKGVTMAPQGRNGRKKTKETTYSKRNGAKKRKEVEKRKPNGDKRIREVVDSQDDETGGEREEESKLAENRSENNEKAESPGQEEKTAPRPKARDQEITEPKQTVSTSDSAQPIETPLPPPPQPGPITPLDWNSFHEVQMPQNTRLSRSLSSHKHQPSTNSTLHPSSTLAGAEPNPDLTQQGTGTTSVSLRKLPPFNIPDLPKIVSHFTKDLIDEKKISEMALKPPTSDLTTLPSMLREGTLAPMPPPLSTAPTEASATSRNISVGDVDMEDVSRATNKGGSKEVSSAKGKRKRRVTNTAQQPSTRPGGETIPCSVPEHETEKSEAFRSLASNDKSGGLLGSRPESEDVDMTEAVDQSEKVVKTPAGKRRRVTSRRGPVASNSASAGPKDMEIEKTDVSTNKENAKPTPDISKSAKAKAKASSKSTSKKTGCSTAGKSTSSGTQRRMAALVTDTPTPIPTLPNLGDSLNSPAFSMRVSPSEGFITAPHRVFALFRDPKSYYYPATVIASESQSQFKVKFDDGTEDCLEKAFLRNLDLRRGDVVKVDLKDMSKSSWVICGFAPHEPTTPAKEGAPGEEDLTDIRGNTLVNVKIKKHGNLVPQANTEGDEVQIPITKIYLIKTLWAQFGNRPYSESGMATMDRQFSAAISPPDSLPIPITPSRAHRVVPSQLSTMGSMSANNTHFTRGLFGGMVFALSFGDKEIDKRTITSKILTNGGKIIEVGFEELFLDIDRPSGISGSQGSIAQEPRAIAFKPETERVGFACVIADQYSRRVKFLQALALGLPCVAGKWVVDCVKHGRVLDWETYLLPAGESLYLGGIVRSRVLRGFPAVGARFVNIVENRKKLLDGKCVIIVMGKSQVERRKAHLFLTYALGASRVRKTPSLESAIKLLSQDAATDKWDFVYVENKDRDRAEKMWSTAAAAATAHNHVGNSGRTKVVDDEWIVQSLILEKLID